MKSAKEMFEELGYEETTRLDHTIQYTLNTEDDFYGEVSRKVITFYKRRKQLKLTNFYTIGLRSELQFDFKELQAIYKQADELRWFKKYKEIKPINSRLEHLRIEEDLNER